MPQGTGSQAGLSIAIPPRPTGGVRHLAIPIPETYVAAAKSLLTSWRNEEQDRKAVELQEQQEEAEYRRRPRREEFELILLTGGGHGIAQTPCDL